MKIKELLLSKQTLVLENINTKKQNNLPILTVGKLLKSFISLNYRLNVQSIALLLTQDETTLENFYKQNIDLLKKSRGTNAAKGAILFKDFPNDNLSIEDKVFIQTLHYFSTYGMESAGIDSAGKGYVPLDPAKPREIAIEKTVDATELNVVSQSKANEIVITWAKDTLSKPVAMTLSDLDTLCEVLKEYSLDLNDVEFKFKENFFRYLSILLSKYSYNKISLLQNADLSFIKTIPDCLRLFRFLSNPDNVMMNTDIHYSSIGRAGRKWFLSRLDKICENNIFAIDDFNRNYGDWIIVFEKLHPGDYSKVYKNIYEVATNLREKTYTTFNGKIISNIKKGNVIAAAKLLKVKPGEFARTLDLLIRSSTLQDVDTILNIFDSISNKISVTVLIQLYEYYLNRNSDRDERVFTIKTENRNKIYVIKNNLSQIPDEIVEKVLNTIQKGIAKQKTESLGKLYLGENMKNYTLPSNDRMVSENLRSIPRGSKIKINLGEKKVLRFFTWWKNAIRNGRQVRTDVDLACIGVDDTYDKLFEYSWRTYNYADSSKYSNTLAFSGDITDAPLPNGASEFVDMDIRRIKEKYQYSNLKYIFITISSYTSVPFAEFECFGGMMIRDKLGKNNEIFTANTVKTKFNVTAKSENVLVAAYDIENDELISIDAPYTNEYASVQVAGESVNKLALECKSLFRNRLSMYDLIKMQSNRYELVDNKSDADIIIDDSDDATIHPWDQEVLSKTFM